MSSYSVAQVETLTGIKAHTLRVWERRYNFLHPKRTSTNIRYYSDEQLRKLLNIGILVRHGYRISQLDQMSDDEINALITEILANPSEENGNEIKGLTLSMLSMNEEEFDKIFSRQLMHKGLLSTITDLIYPFLRHVGVLWSTKKAMPAQEHFISNLIRQKIISAIENLPLAPAAAPAILLFLLEGEDHEIGLLLATYIAKDLGWRVCYLGQNVPAQCFGSCQAQLDDDHVHHTKTG
jgi:MerR family transcriptional regulator, light-induced transcriptional regulator